HKAVLAVSPPQDRVVVTSDPAEILAARRIVLPGVGAFGACLQGLMDRPGLLGALSQAVLDKRIPFLGICVGMQLLASVGYEHGLHHGLGWMAGEVGAIPKAQGLKIPHMGWNTLTVVGDHPVLGADFGGASVYFVHSYHLTPKDPAVTLATVDYGMPLVAAVGQGNILGVQFHPEKSGPVGLRLLQNFIQWEP
ncbi:MAG: imidazole glycerol phosphate synthase subunit HisH, partial [Alphaproteobacteria bacterium]